MEMVLLGSAVRSAATLAVTASCLAAVAPPPASTLSDALLYGWVCSETVVRERYAKSRRTSRTILGPFDYLLAREPQEGGLPLLPRELRYRPGGDRRVDLRTIGPAPLVWRALEDGDGAAFRFGPAEGSGTAFRGGFPGAALRDPRAWEGRLLRDDRDRVVWVDAAPRGEAARNRQLLERYRMRFQIAGIRLGRRPRQRTCTAEFHASFEGRPMPSRVRCETRILQTDGRARLVEAEIRTFDDYRAFRAEAAGSAEHRQPPEKPPPQRRDTQAPPRQRERRPHQPAVSR